MAHKLQIQYDEMDSIAKMFENYADEWQETIGRLDSAKDALQGGGWKGPGSEAYYDEYENEVLPKTKILQMGYEVAGQKTREMSQMFQDAEQTILSYFASL
jgi:WXG100 family type VII secretion target